MLAMTECAPVASPFTVTGAFSSCCCLVAFVGVLLQSFSGSFLPLDLVVEIIRCALRLEKNPACVADHTLIFIVSVVVLGGKVSGGGFDCRIADIACLKGFDGNL
jgi:hypothetical protein